MDQTIGQGASGGVYYDGKIAGLYDLEETLGSGHFAVVKLARHVFTGAKVAVKVVDKTKLDEISKSHLFQEVRCMKLVQHPNVVRLYEVIDTLTKLYLVLEFGDGGDLYDYIMKHEHGLNEDLARKYFRQIAKAISYCHQLHVVHRDLKPENVVFFEKQEVVKLTDFGFSNKFSPGKKLETSCGSLAYSAPEILLGDSYDAPGVDIWSLGVILYMLVCGHPPFEKANDSETLTMIMDCKYSVPSHISVECRNLISSMLVRDPEKRATLDQISKHPWLEQNSLSDSINNKLPLVSRHELSEEDHAFILQKIINGKIASKEEIMKSLDKNQYNHITATYFLLAEIRLRKRKEEQMKNRYPKKMVTASTSRHPPGIDAENKFFNKALNKLVVPINVEVGSIHFVDDSSQEKRVRKCSIVREEDEDEFMCSMNKYEVLVTTKRRESISDGRLCESVQEHTEGINSRVLYMESSKKPESVNVTLVEKLNITEQKIGINVPKLQTFLDTDRKVSKQISGNRELCEGLESLTINELKNFSGTNKNPILTHRKAKLSKIRTPSCSSSEASDDDTRSRNKKKINKFVGDTPNRLVMHRRDSHDDSSDSQDQTIPSTGSHYFAGDILNSNSSTTGDNNKSKNHTKKEKNRSPNSRESSEQIKVRNYEKQTQNINSVLFVNIHQQRIRESQSLDRITEAQEYNHHYRYAPFPSLLSAERNVQQASSLYDLNSFSVVETKEEYDDEDKALYIKEIQGAWKEQSKCSSRTKKNANNLLKLCLVDEIDVIIYVNNLTKVFQMAGEKCYVTINKFRRFGKYFSTINFS